MPVWITLFFLIIGFPKFVQSQPFEKSLPILNEFGIKSPKKLVTVSAISQPEAVSPGNDFRIHVRVLISPGSHIYSLNESYDENLATRLDLESAPFESEEPWEESPPKIMLDEVFQKMVKTHESIAQFTKKFSVPSSFKSGDFSFTGALIFRLCDNHTCSMPQEEVFKTSVKVFNLKKKNFLEFND